MLSAAEYSTVLYVQYSALCCVVLRCAVLFYAVLYHTVLYCTVPHSTLLYSVQYVQYCTSSTVHVVFAPSTNTEGAPQLPWKFTRDIRQPATSETTRRYSTVHYRTVRHKRNSTSNTTVVARKSPFPSSAVPAQELTTPPTQTWRKAPLLLELATMPSR